MEVKSSLGIIVLRIICIVLITLSIYNYLINPVFFGFIIGLFSIFFLFSSYRIIKITDYEIRFESKSLISIKKKVKSIKISDIKSIEYFEGADFNFFFAFLDFIFLGLFRRFGGVTAISIGRMIIVLHSGKVIEYYRNCGIDKFIKAIKFIRTKLD